MYKKITDLNWRTQNCKIWIEQRKAAQSINKSTQAMQSAMHSKENEMAQVKNELARIKVDSLNTIAHNEQLKATVKEVDEELRRKEGLIAKYQLESRRRNDEIEKKMRDLDGLNRKFEALRSRLDAAAGDAAAAVGPLEATIKNLRNEVEQKRRACGDLQRMWMSTQTELVKLANEAAAQAEKVSEMESQAAVLSQKRVRMEGQVRMQEKELKEVRSGIEQMHAEMGKLNELMSKNQGLCETLEDQSFTMETDFVNTLKDMEEEIVRLEAQARAQRSSARNTRLSDGAHEEACWQRIQTAQRLPCVFESARSLLAHVCILKKRGVVFGRRK